ADHGDEGGDGGILRDEALVPRLRNGSDEHQFEAAAPDDAPTEPCEDGKAFPPIGGIGLRTRDFAPIRIGGLVAKADEIEHMDRAGPLVRSEGCKSFLSRVDMAAHGCTLFSASLGCKARMDIFWLLPKGADRRGGPGFSCAN